MGVDTGDHNDENSFIQFVPGYDCYKCATFYSFLLISVILSS